MYSFQKIFQFYSPVLSQGARLASKGVMKGGLKIKKPKDQPSPSQSFKIKSTVNRNSRNDNSDVKFMRYTHTPKMKTPGPAVPASIEEKCKTVHSTLNNEVQSKLMKPKKTKRLIRSPIKITKTFNKFETLEIEECNIVEMEMKKEKFRHCKLKQKKPEKDYVSNLKDNKKGWQKYETKNRFEVLKDNDEKDINKILTTNKVLKTPKSSLKKCKRCNFKKRSCILNPSSCKAINKSCIKCKKNGHYPQSPNCKAGPKVNKSKHSKNKIHSKNVEQRKLCLDSFFLINRRIIQLEGEIKSNSIKEDLKTNSSSEEIPVDLIPFLFMYIFMNYESFCIINDEKYKFNTMEGKRKCYEQENILKLAKYCAKKFESNDTQTSEEYFITYCSKQIQKVFQDESVLNSEDYSSMKKVLSAYDIMYYKTLNRVDQNQISEDQGQNGTQNPEFNDQVKTIYENECKLKKDHQLKALQDQHKLKEDQSAMREDHHQESDKSKKVNQHDGFDQNTELLLSQLDGVNDTEISEDDEEKVDKNVFAVNCEIKEITNLINFFRSFDFL